MKNDINKNMSGTESWGPAAWKFLHSVTFNYSDHPSLNEQRNMEQFFYSLKNLLPCDECKNHFENEIRLHPPDTRSKETISSWLVDIHNRINRRLGKQIITYDKAKQLYEKDSKCKSCNGNHIINQNYNNNATTTNNKYVWLFTFLCICGIIVYYYCNKLKYLKK